jgi:hypothetical protein
MAAMASAEAGLLGFPGRAEERYLLAPRAA